MTPPQRMAVGAALVALALCGCGSSSEPRSQAVVSRKGTERLAVKAPTTHQGDMVAGRRFRALLEVPWTGPTSIELTRSAAGSQQPLGSTRVTGRGRRHFVPAVVPLDRGAVSAIDRCQKQTIVLTAQPVHGDGLGQARLAVRLDPPQCGNFFGSTSVWNSKLPAHPPLDENSAAISRTLGDQVRAEFAERFPPTVNIDQYSVPIYTVPSGQPRVPVALDRPDAYANGLRKTFAAGVPIPPDAQPAKGTDGHLLVWQPGTDTMWELFAARHQAGGWIADWGGRTDRASTSPGAFYDPSGTELGATGSSLALAGGLITMRDVARGRIDHALAIAVPETRSGVWALPASRSDGASNSPSSIPEGARFQVDPAIDVDKLGLPPLTRMIVRAAQRFGMIVRDKAGTTVFYAEDPTRTGQDPYAKVIGTGGLDLERFPWRSVRLVRMELRTYGNKAVSPVRVEGRG